MFCKHCGIELKENVRFCRNCGTPVADNTEMVPNSGITQTTGDTVSGNVSNKKKKWIVPLIAGGVVLVALVIGGAIFAKNFFFNEDTNISMRDEEEERVVEESQTAESTEVADEISQDINGITLLSTDTVEGQLQQEILAMNDSSYSEAVIDVYAENYAPGERDVNATWDRTVFYCLEGYEQVSDYMDKNSCALVKKEMKNAETGNIMQYDIYVNTSNNIPNKIVSIEYLTNGVEITEYYYDNAGKVNFVFQYTADNYVSGFATPDKTGERYLFQNDCMVTWRSITETETTNYVLGDAEVERMKNQFAKSTMVYYSSLPEEGMAEFDAREKKMLNAAYNTYNIVLNSEGIAHIQGYAYDGNGQGISQTVVELYATDFSTPIYQTMTDESGMYCIYIPNEEYKYNIRVSKDGMISADIYLIEMSAEQIGAYQDSVYLFDESSEDATIQMTLGDAFEYASDGNGMVRLSGADVCFRPGINNRLGEIVWQGTADETGYLQVTLAPGVYTVEVNASDHETMFYTAWANPLKDISTYEFYATPILNEGEYAIVLTWGAYPSDLDSHLFTTSGTDTDHIWFGDRYDEFNSYLDVDDTDSYGPETITIYDFNSTKYYKYCVVDYTNCSGGNYRSMEMSNSMACVNVYSSEGLIATYNVPTGNEGVIWEVFEIRNGQITPIQRYYGNVEDKTWWHDEK